MKHLFLISTALLLLPHTVLANSSDDEGENRASVVRPGPAGKADDRTPDPASGRAPSPPPAYDDGGAAAAQPSGPTPMVQLSQALNDSKYPLFTNLSPADKGRLIQCANTYVQQGLPADECALGMAYGELFPNPPAAAQSRDAGAAASPAAGVAAVAAANNDTRARAVTRSASKAPARHTAAQPAAHRHQRAVTQRPAQRSTAAQPRVRRAPAAQAPAPRARSSTNPVTGALYFTGDVVEGVVDGVVITPLKALGSFFGGGSSSDQRRR